LPVEALPLLNNDRYFEHADECSVEIWLAFLGHRWNALILYHLSLEPRRFGALRECLPSITPKILTERLSDLDHAGLIRIPQRGGHYGLTDQGQSLMPLLNAIEEWSRDKANPSK
jgi:DNA-binding HxlR family transcriptional regulator